MELAIKKIAYEKLKEPVTNEANTFYYDLVPIFKKADKFGRWSLDPLFNHLKIYLVLPESASFPLSWKLDKGVICNPEFSRVLNLLLFFLADLLSGKNGMKK